LHWAGLIIPPEQTVTGDHYPDMSG
jgi:hypothetical protein